MQHNWLFIVILNINETWKLDVEDHLGNTHWLTINTIIFTTQK